MVSKFLENLKIEYKKENLDKILLEVRKSYDEGMLTLFDLRDVGIDLFSDFSPKSQDKEFDVLNALSDIQGDGEDNECLDVFIKYTDNILNLGR